MTIDLAEVAAVLTTVWTPEALLLAAVAGMGIGALVLASIALKPAYASAATPGQVARAIAYSGMVTGGVFYVGQALVDTAEDIPRRLISRFAIWCVYSLFMGLGTWLRLRLEAERRHRILHTVAVAEVEAAVLAS
jgi:hypothetical protein